VVSTGCTVGTGGIVAFSAAATGAISARGPQLKPMNALEVPSEALDATLPGVPSGCEDEGVRRMLRNFAGVIGVPPPPGITDDE
jgi:hypothetical protein